jgi:hypothetical protein
MVYILMSATSSFYGNPIKDVVAVFKCREDAEIRKDAEYSRGGNVTYYVVEARLN